jgi:hypothetical protein
MPSVAETMAGTERFQLTDPRARTRLGGLAGEAAQAGLAAGGAERYQQAMSAAFSAKLGRGEAAGTLEDYDKSWMPWRGLALRSEADAILARQEQKLGLEVGGDRSTWQDISGFDILEQEKELGSRYDQRIKSIVEAGGQDPFAARDRETIDLAIKQVDIQTRSEQHLADIAKALEQSRVGGAPSRPPIANPAPGDRR